MVDRTILEVELSKVDINGKDVGVVGRVGSVGLGDGTGNGASVGAGVDGVGAGVGASVRRFVDGTVPVTLVGAGRVTFT